MILWIYNVQLIFRQFWHYKKKENNYEWILASVLFVYREGYFQVLEEPWSWMGITDSIPANSWALKCALWSVAELVASCRSSCRTDRLPGSQINTRNSHIVGADHGHKSLPDNQHCVDVNTNNWALLEPKQGRWNHRFNKQMPHGQVDATPGCLRGCGCGTHPSY